MLFRYPFFLMILSMGISIGWSEDAMAWYSGKEIEIVWIGEQDDSFESAVQSALAGLQGFAADHGWEDKVDASLVSKIRHFGRKDEFDNELREASGGKMMSIPETYVGVMDKGLLRIVSWSAYKMIFPRHVKEDYIRLIQHELAHQLHADLVGEDSMGPRWFYEGFAVVAADQYQDFEGLNQREIVEVINSGRSESYEEFGFVVRELMKKHSLPVLIQKAGLPEADFRRWL